MKGHTCRFVLLFGLLLVLLGLTAAVAGCGQGEETAAPTATTEVPVATITAGSAAKAAVARQAFEALIKPSEPGCSVAVGEDGEVVWAEGFGLANLEIGKPIGPDTVFDIGSTTKQFTATAVLLLAQEGKLDLDAPLSRYLPQLPSWAGRVTLRQMMHHQSGIPDYGALFMNRDYTYSQPLTWGDAMEVIIKWSQPLTAEDTMALFGELRELLFEPGTTWSYSNSNYVLLGQVVESLTGQTLKDYLASEVFEPLGLKAVLDKQARIPEKAASYSIDHDRWFYFPENELWETVGDGGLRTTPSDLVRWAREYWDPTIGGPELLAARTEGAVELSPGSSTRYGAGIMTMTRDDGGPLLKHGGNFAGFRTELAMLPDERLAVAVSCNRGWITPELFMGEVEGLVDKVIAAWRGS